MKFYSDGRGVDTFQFSDYNQAVKGETRHLHITTDQQWQIPNSNR